MQPSRVPLSRTAPTGGAWHAATIADGLAALGSDALRGLSPAEAERRLARDGPNALGETVQPALWERLAAPLRDLGVLLLLAAAVLSATLGEWPDALAIGLIVLLNAAVSIAQAWRADQALAALAARAAPMARAVRDAQVCVLPARQLVVGDLIQIEAGQQLPADVRWIECKGLQIDESALTGESGAILKLSAPPLPAQTPLADRTTLGHAGTLALTGHGTGLVVATGMSTEVGRIAGLLGETQRPATPLQQRLTHLARQLAVGVVLLCLALVVLGLMRGQPLLPLLTLAVSLAVAAIPEALPAAMTVLLSLGAHRMAQAQALVRRLSAMEVLGAVDVICTDKTGTLTANQMAVNDYWCAGSPQVLWQAVLLNNDARSSDLEREIPASPAPDPSCETVGVHPAQPPADPTEIALLKAALEAGLDQDELIRRWPRVDERVFDSQRKRMSTLHAERGPGLQPVSSWLQITKGAPESIIPLCTQVLGAQGMDPTQALEHAEAMARRGLRVLAVAQRLRDTVAIEEEALGLIGLVGLMDPPRPGAREAIAECLAAGITPIMITGDHPATAQAVAVALGMSKPDAPVLTGLQLDALDDEELQEALDTVRVFARVSPEHKLRLVQALQAGGARVAMTGDGVNDAPALQRADIGVAMGRSGTDVARQASALVLLDDHFATIVLAIREGRRIQANLHRFLTFVLSGNATELIAIGLAPLVGLPVLLWPVQILWINLVTDGLPGLALASERGSADLMRHETSHASDPVLGPAFWRQVLLFGASGGVGVLALQAWATEHHAAQAGTMVFTAITLAQLLVVMALRSERQAIWRMAPWGNPALLLTVGLSLALHAAIVQSPGLQGVFHTVPLNGLQWGLCALPALGMLLVVEIRKAWRASA